MGHTRLGTIPKSQKWAAIVKELSTGAARAQARLPLTEAEVAALAARVLAAASAALDRTLSDKGAQLTVGFLAELALWAKAPEWRVAFSNAGLAIGPNDSPLDVLVRLQASLDDRLTEHDAHSDIAEMAQRAAGDALAAMALRGSGSLFPGAVDETQEFIKGLSTKKGFATVGHTFFSSFLGRFLNFYLSRLTPAQLGTGRFEHLGDLAAFETRLRRHCEQTALIVRDFSGSWFSKAAFDARVNPQGTARFLAVALKKLRSEVERQRAAS